MPDAPIGVPDSFEEHVGLMFDLLALAYQADLTRVFTFMMARELSQRTYPQIGVTEPHHSMSHHGNNAGQDRRRTPSSTPITCSCSPSSSRSCASTPDGDGSLLDHSLILYGSGMSNGNVHAPSPLPLAVGRRAARARRAAHRAAGANAAAEPAAWRVAARVRRATLPGFGVSTGSGGVCEARRS